jgi:D-threo-aldose 1-dehydrogenase
MGEELGRRRLGRTTLAVTALGFGGAPLGELFEPVPEPVVEATLEAAWQGGVRYFDTAPWYGHGLSELREGAGLRRRPRADFALSTKVGRVYRRPGDPTRRPTGPWVGGLNFELRFDYSRDGIMRSYEDSLMRLGLPRVDMLVVHDLDEGYHGAEGVRAHLEALDRGGGFAALLELRRAGEIRAIAAGINHAPMIARFLERFELVAFLVAMPYTLLDQGVLDGVFPELERRGIGVVIGAPYASGILAMGAVPGARYAYAPAGEAVLERVRGIEAACTRHGVPLRAAALRFPLFHPVVAAVIPGAQTPAQAEDNIAMVRTEIPTALWAELKAEGLLRADAPTG